MTASDNIRLKLLYRISTGWFLCKYVVPELIAPVGPFVQPEDCYSPEIDYVYIVPGVWDAASSDIMKQMWRDYCLVLLVDYRLSRSYAKFCIENDLEGLAAGEQQLDALEKPEQYAQLLAYINQWKVNEAREETLNIKYRKYTMLDNSLHIPKIH